MDYLFNPRFAGSLKMRAVDPMLMSEKDMKKFSNELKHRTTSCQRNPFSIGDRPFDIIQSVPLLSG